MEDYQISNLPSSIKVEPGTIALLGKNLPYMKVGNGVIPVIVVGLAESYMEALKGLRLDQIFTYYLVDMYWTGKLFAYPETQNFTLHDLTYHIELLRQALKLDKIVILGHSIPAVLVSCY